VCIAGCANPPSLELNEARAALALARDYEADVYAPDQYANALMNLQLAEAEIDDQASVPRMARSYERASAFLTFAVEEAEEARILAEEFKEDIFRQAEGNLPEAEDALETAYQTYNNALGILAYQEAQSMARSLDEARQSLPEARRLIETGAAAQAAALLNEVLVTARSIETRAQFIIDTNPDTN
jgi:hypothetical protein